MRQEGGQNQYKIEYTWSVIGAYFIWTQITALIILQSLKLLTMFTGIRLRHPFWWRNHILT